MKNNSESARKTIFWNYKHGSKKRGYIFELTLKQFTELTKQNCWYCGVKPGQIKYSGGDKQHWCFYNGIDRMDNEIGYTEPNCIPCCGKCNNMKGLLSGEVFINQVRAVACNLGLL